MNEYSSLKSYTLDEVKHLKIHGRWTGCLNPLVLFWTGSGIELNINGSQLWVEIEADYDTYEPWISILINKIPVSRQMVTKGRHTICIFRNMDPKKVKNIRILRDSQAMSGDLSCSLKIHSIKTDGSFMPAADKPYKIEFVGDSISSGEGAVGARSEEDWIPVWFSAIHNYCTITAEALDADYRIISQSGWGVLSSWDNNPHCNLPEHYEQICGVLNGEKNEALGAFMDNDFNAWQPDIIVVNLGTNDENAFQSPEWKDPDTGKIYKQRIDEDGCFNKEDLKAFEAAVENFLYKLRGYNRNAYIIWAYGMLGSTMEPYICNAIAAYTGKTGDRKVSFLKLPDTTSETVGARWHPGRLSHEKAARVLIEYIKSLL